MPIDNIKRKKASSLSKYGPLLRLPFSTLYSQKTTNSNSCGFSFTLKRRDNDFLFILSVYSGFFKTLSLNLKFLKQGFCFCFLVKEAEAWWWWHLNTAFKLGTSTTPLGTDAILWH